MNRKVFLKTTGRILILGGMAAATGYLAVNHKVDTTCSESSACRKCRQFADCKLPQAVEEKNIYGSKRKDNGKEQ